MDSEPLFLRAINELVTRAGNAPISEDENEEHLLGTTVEETWVRLKQLRRLPDTIESYIQQYDDVVRQVLRRDLVPQPGVVELLNECAPARAADGGGVVVAPGLGAAQAGSHRPAGPVRRRSGGRRRGQRQTQPGNLPAWRPTPWGCRPDSASPSKTRPSASKPPPGRGPTPSPSAPTSPATWTSPGPTPFWTAWRTSTFPCSPESDETAAGTSQIPDVMRCLTPK